MPFYHQALPASSTSCFWPIIFKHHVLFAHISLQPKPSPHPQIFSTCFLSPPDFGISFVPSMQTLSSHHFPWKPKCWFFCLSVCLPTYLPILYFSYDWLLVPHCLSEHPSQALILTSILLPVKTVTTKLWQAGFGGKIKPCSAASLITKLLHNWGILLQDAAQRHGEKCCQVQG